MNSLPNTPTGYHNPGPDIGHTYVESAGRPRAWPVTRNRVLKYPTGIAIVLKLRGGTKRKYVMNVSHLLIQHARHP